VKNRKIDKNMEYFFVNMEYFRIFAEKFKINKKNE